MSGTSHSLPDWFRRTPEIAAHNERHRRLGGVGEPGPHGQAGIGETERIRERWWPTPRQATRGLARVPSVPRRVMRARVDDPASPTAQRCRTRTGVDRKRRPEPTPSGARPWSARSICGGYCPRSVVSFSLSSELRQRCSMSRVAITAANLPTPLNRTSSSTRTVVPIVDGFRL
jgi:hypothetical protein